MFFAMDAILKKYLCNLYFSLRQLQEIKSLYPLCNKVFRGRLPLVARTLYLRRVPVIADDADPTYNNPEIFFYRARRHRFAITG